LTPVASWWVSAVGSFAAALLAAALAYATNRSAQALGGRTAVVFVAPALEESLKTGAALLVGAPVLWTHLCFGLIEALYDVASPASGPGRSRALGAAAAGLAGHALFGAVTVAGAAAVAVTGSLAAWAPGVVLAYLVHVGWNGLVMGRVTPRR